jgi:hypothetical protein
MGRLSSLSTRPAGPADRLCRAATRPTPAGAPDGIVVFVALSQEVCEWAKKGSRPRAVHDQRTQSTYLFGAVCPELGTGAALLLPACNSEAMQLHLDEIATKVSPGAHAILLLDQAGWHGAKILKVPSNITLMPLPPRAPELNGQENIWQFMRQNWLSNRIFKSFDDIVDHCCYAWNTLIDQPWKIMSVARRDWATMGYSM